MAIRGLGLCAGSRSRSTAIVAIGLALSLGGCGGFGKQIEERMDHTPISIEPGDVVRDGVGFLTPSAATGREADKQALAYAFAETLISERPDIRVVSLSGILSAVNAAGLDQEYKQMYRDYLETGILDADLLRRIGEIGGVRFFAQLNLAGFEQASRGRWSFFGLRLLDTKQANMRVFIQLWDSRTGSVAWEGGGEVNYSYESMGERPITFHRIAEAAARRMYRELPRSDDETRDP